MKNTKHYRKFFLLILMFAFFLNVQAQQNVVSSGGDASSATGSISYSVGQVQYKTIESDSGIVTEGVQQPYEIFEIVAVEELSGPEMTVYPNPVTDYVLIEIPQFSDEDLSFYLRDMNGRLIQESKIRSSKTEIGMTSLEAGIYFLQVTLDGQKFKNFKIIKNK